MVTESINISNKEGFTSQVKVSSDVIATIAAFATTEVEGVAFLQGTNSTKDIIGKFGIKNTSKGVTITFNEDGTTAYVDIVAAVKYGFSIPDICKAIQDKVKNAIESMVGITVDSVNVRITEVDTENK